jgi:hypothetical protein
VLSATQVGFTCVWRCGTLSRRPLTSPHRFKARGKIDANEVIGLQQEPSSPEEEDGELLTMW